MSSARFFRYFNRSVRAVLGLRPATLRIVFHRYAQSWRRSDWIILFLRAFAIRSGWESRSAKISAISGESNGVRITESGHPKCSLKISVSGCSPIMTVPAAAPSKYRKPISLCLPVSKGRSPRCYPPREWALFLRQSWHLSAVAIMWSLRTITTWVRASC